MNERPRVWQKFFDQHAPHYMQNPFTANTRAEVEFLLELLELPKGSRILDMGCGTGRHAVMLAERGFRVTGVDLSEGMLNEARKAATDAGVEVEWIHADATTWESDTLFDAAICLCEGAIGLADLDEEPVSHDLAVLRRIYGALRPNARFVMTALNGYAVIRQMTDELVTEGRFDPASMLSIYEDEWELPEGKQTMQIRERLLIPPEMVAILRHVGFTVEAVWGGTAGEWGRRPVKLDEVEAMYVAVKE
jgi:ubiquinone/menaquinone biosynthesis C-methylase UbiE